MANQYFALAISNVNPFNNCCILKWPTNMKTHLLTNKQASLEVYEYGAHVTSWISQTGQQRIFTSKQAIFEEPIAIRGGIPIIFPQFNERGPIVRHGFARNMNWQVLNKNQEKIVFELKSDQHTQLLWPYHFRALYSIELHEQSLSLSLTIKNTDSKPFSFTGALHSYFKINQLSKSSINGLKDLKYWDNNGSNFTDRKTESNSSLTFNDAIDRVYFKLNTPINFNNGIETLTIAHEGFDDCVIWNPCIEDAKKMRDFSDEEYNQMLCIEAAQVDQPIELMPNEVWTGTQTISQT